MTLSSALVSALKSFNEQDPVTRAAIFPITDGADFLNRVMSSPESHASAVTGSNSSLPGRAGMPSPGIKRDLAEGVSESIQDAKLDPYVFSPPGMDID